MSTGFGRRVLARALTIDHSRHEKGQRDEQLFSGAALVLQKKRLLERMPGWRQLFEQGEQAPPASEASFLLLPAYWSDPPRLGARALQRRDPRYPPTLLLLALTHLFPWVLGELAFSVPWHLRLHVVQPSNVRALRPPSPLKSKAKCAIGVDLSAKG